jgi:hypothetical protein
MLDLPHPDSGLRDSTVRKTVLIASAALAALFACTTTSNATDLVFTLKNTTSGTLERFYTSPVGVDDWEEDVFGKDVLEPGESIEITIADGRRVCKYDLRFEFTEDSGLEDLEDSQDLCKMGSYTIHE